MWGNSIHSTTDSRIIIERSINMEDIYVIGEYKDTAIYLTHEKWKKNIYAWVKSIR